MDVHAVERRHYVHGLHVAQGSSGTTKKSWPKEESYEQANDWGWVLLHLDGETGLIHMESSPLAVVAFLSQLAPATMSSFETQNLEETQMLQRELHRESLHQGFLRSLVWHLWHSSSSSLSKKPSKLPQSHYHTRPYHSSNLKYKISLNCANKRK